MIRSRLLAVPASILFLFAVTPAEEMTVDEGIIAVYIRAPEFVGRGEYNGDNLLNCLKNHIDYYLWYKGWQFEFLEADTAVSREYWRDSLRDGTFKYLLYIRPKATIKLEETSTNDGEENTSIQNYDCRLRIELEAFLDNLETGETMIRGKKAGAKADRGWVTIDDENEASDPVGPVEPPDFTVKRALTAVLSFLPEKERNRLISADDIPVYLVVDKEIDEDCQSGVECSYRVAFDYASRSLRKQYGFGLKLCGQTHLSARNLTMASINSLFNNILKSQPFRRDTLTAGIFRPDRPYEYYQPNRRLKVGLSDLGRQVLLIAELSPPNQMTSEWKGFLNGQLLLHEMGHLLGAIHVSDINSIMCSRAVWVSSDLFDPLNDYIIRTTCRQGRPYQNITGYLEFVIDCINETGYKLSDYPGYFFSYINQNKEIMKSGLLDSEGLERSVFYAVKAYGRFILKDYKTARDGFYRALVCDSTQGAVHYYISKVTSGPLSNLHLKKSAGIGYYGAIHEYINLEK